MPHFIRSVLVPILIGVGAVGLFDPETPLQLVLTCAGAVVLSFIWMAATDEDRRS